MLSHPGGGSAVVVDEERPSIGGYPHLPARRQEALLRLVLRLGGAVGRRLGRLWVGECVFYSPPHLDVVGSLEQKCKPCFQTAVKYQQNSFLFILGTGPKKKIEAEVNF